VLGTPEEYGNPHLTFEAGGYVIGCACALLEVLVGSVGGNLCTLPLEKLFSHFIYIWQISTYTVSFLYHEDYAHLPLQFIV
jgi:hypothetical protein